MPVFETFAKRQKRLRGDEPDVYTYDYIPEPLRVQIVQIMFEILGGADDLGDYGNGPSIRIAYGVIVKTLRKEMGVFHLPPTREAYRDYDAHELSKYMLTTPSADDFLSATEIVCRLIENMASKTNYRGKSKADEIAKDAIEEINARFKEHGLGYEYSVGELVRIDSELIHSEAVKPALALLRDPQYRGAEEEFRKAYEDYRKGDHKSALTEALKTLESTIKCICEKRNWSYAKTDTASKLIKVCFDNALIPAFWEGHFSGLRATLEAGVPTARNKIGGHGQGATPTVVPDYLVGYVLHMTASAIVFLVKAEQALP